MVVGGAYPEADGAGAAVVRVGVEAGGAEGVDRLAEVEAVEQPHPLVEVLLRQRRADLDVPLDMAEVGAQRGLAVAAGRGVDAASGVERRQEQGGTPAPHARAPQGRQ